MFYKQLIGNLIGIWLLDPEKDCEFLDLFCKDMQSWNVIEWECNLPITATEQPSPFHLLKCRPGDFFSCAKIEYFGTWSNYFSGGISKEWPLILDLDLHFLWKNVPKMRTSDKPRRQNQTTSHCLVTVFDPTR